MAVDRPPSFPAEEPDTEPVRATPSARPARRSPGTSPTRSSSPDIRDAFAPPAPPPPPVRPRPPLRSTTYSVLSEDRARSGAPNGARLSTLQRDAIDSVFARLNTFNHYDLLGVPQDASVAEIRAAFEEVVSTFESSILGRAKLGPYADKIKAVLERLHDAYTTLSVRDRRAMYDARVKERSGGESK